MENLSWGKQLIEKDWTWFCSVKRWGRKQLLIKKRLLFNEFFMGTNCSKTDSFKLEECISSSVERHHILIDFFWVVSWLSFCTLTSAGLQLLSGSAAGWDTQLGNPTRDFTPWFFYKTYGWSRFTCRQHFCNNVHTSVTQSITQVSRAMLMYFRLIPGVSGSLQVFQESLIIFAVEPMNINGVHAVWS